MRWSILVGSLMVCMLAAPVGAQPPEEHPAHNELRALRDDALAAFHRRDIEGVMKHVHERIIFTPLDAEVCHGADEVRAYYQKMMEGPAAIVKDLTVEMTVDQLSSLHGEDTAIAAGTAAGSFELMAGLSFTTNDRWSATLVKQDGRWQVASLHFSSDLFDNPLLNAARKSRTIAAIVAVLVGLLIGYFIGRKRSPKAPAPQEGPDAG